MQKSNTIHTDAEDAQSESCPICSEPFDETNWSAQNSVTYAYRESTTYACPEECGGLIVVNTR